MEVDTTTRTIIPETGLSKEHILQQLHAFKGKDLSWKTGKVFAYLYELSEEDKKFIHQAYTLFLSENGLDPTAFPSLLKLENDLISMAVDLLGGTDESTGSFTSGGTESIILAVKTARDYARQHYPHITKPNLVIPSTGHAAFHKAGHYLDVEIRTVDVDLKTFGVRVEDMAAAMNDQTILLVGSAPGYPHGVADPITEIAALAKNKGVFCHVDACVGGMYLPFAKQLGYAVPDFDLSVDGVTSISCDFHKYGYTAKGASCVLYKNGDLRQYQIFSCSNWAGYSIINPTVLSSKTGGPLAGAWATLHFLGQEGYRKIVKGTQIATEKVLAGIQAIPELEVMGNPIMNLVAIKSVDPAISVFDLADVMTDKGWHLQVQLAHKELPEAIHLSINRINTPHIKPMLKELQESIQALKNKKTEDNPLKVLALDPSMIATFIDNLSPEMLDQLEQLLGFGGDGVPDKLGMVNHIMNGLSSTQRDKLLIAFMHRLFSVK